MSTNTFTATVATDMHGKEIKVGDSVAYACIQGYSKRAVLRTGKVIGAVIDTNGTMLRISGTKKVYDYRSQSYSDRSCRYTTRNFSKLMVLS